MSSSFVFFFFWGMGAERTSWGGRGEPVVKAREATPEVARRVRNNFRWGGWGGGNENGNGNGNGNGNENGNGNGDGKNGNCGLFPAVLVGCSFPVALELSIVCVFFFPHLNGYLLYLYLHLLLISSILVNLYFTR